MPPTQYLGLNYLGFLKSVTAFNFFLFFQEPVLPPTSSAISTPGPSSIADEFVHLQGQDSQATSVASSFEQIAPLMTTFREAHEDMTTEARKEMMWEDHFGTFGKGVSMYRTEEAVQLVLKGIPDR